LNRKVDGSIGDRTASAIDLSSPARQENEGLLGTDLFGEEKRKEFVDDLEVYFFLLA
jgi:hypothetical protein